MYLKKKTGDFPLQILTVSDQFALNAQIVIYNLEEEKQNERKVDVSVDVTMGCLKIVFLNWFISNMLVSMKFG